LPAAIRRWQLKLAGEGVVLLHKLFNGVRSEDRARLLQQQRVLKLATNDVLVSAGQSCAAAFFVVVGSLRVETPGDDGTPALTGFLRTEDLYLESLSHSQYTTHNTLRAALASVVHVLPLQALQDIVMRYPDIGLMMLQQCIAGVSKLRGQLRHQKSKDVRTQVARAIFDVAATASDGSRVLDRKITQSTLAEYTGLSREAVNKELKGLSEAGVVRKSERGMELDEKLSSTDFLPWNDQM
jgi:CRP/FNR family transcriptional regulator, cyclic AMP receptor protein